MSCLKNAKQAINTDDVRIIYTVLPFFKWGAQVRELVVTLSKVQEGMVEACKSMVQRIAKEKES